MFFGPENSIKASSLTIFRVYFFLLLRCIRQRQWTKLYLNISCIQFSFVFDALFLIQFNIFNIQQLSNIYQRKNTICIQITLELTWDITNSQLLF
ncbi:transmembrane protein, putative (macronuclear) [Tetrahymena thermophila SB210]|uniref:Transmembrane protein, putative n=1 Tax=Tetrahymena thermophila (strain SB210) TaxID=312017 RepID=W7XEC4_TETTS|nr:transmembrane protein, putative [Tetrahymena thermophila SB210]EWS76017.1 transmembrane protein, putative [Tetrahymena thermophila SB210]|eukprot:XP_012651455.1 transmembrane protein, putative [Tetrahymena thermophila SB210]